MANNSSYINHLGLVRGRFQGSGNLITTALSFNQVSFSELANITLAEATDKYVESLANFQKQKMQIEFAVDVIDEWFEFGEVIPFLKPVASGYPR